jgi:mRNA interferase YafQ
MRTLSRTTQFKKDYKRECRRRCGNNLDAELRDAIKVLLVDAAPPQRYRDHPLAGQWYGYRDCHLRSDLILVYTKTASELRLVRLGSHSDLGIGR